MDVATIYRVRNEPRAPLSEEIHAIIAKLKITFKPTYRRPAYAHAKPRVQEATNWRENVLVDVVRKVREKDDADYDEVNAYINKLTKQTFDKMMTQIREKLAKRDEMFRLRVTTLLFDRGIRQNFYAAIMADAYARIVAEYPDARDDLASQVLMFEKLYDVSNVTVLPAADDPGFDAAIIEWTKQKEKKRGFAVYVAELYSRDLLPAETMTEFINKIKEEVLETVAAPATSAKEEHVDALIRFLFAVHTKVPAAKGVAAELLALPRASTPNLNMKSRFRLEDMLKV